VKDHRAQLVAVFDRVHGLGNGGPIQTL
jgi:hypothetical protein